MAGPPHTINKLPVLKQIPIFSQLGSTDLHAVAAKSTLVEFKKGDIISQEGTPPDALYCLISGRLQAYKTRPSGEREVVELIFRGMYFGIISLLTGEHHSLTFEAINDSIVLKINKDDFYAILKQVPQLGIEFSRSLSRRLRTQVERPKSVFESTVISIYSPVKGSGSSTYAINLALSLERETKKKVIFLSIVSRNEEVGISKVDERSASPQWRVAPIKLREIVGDHDRIIKSIYKEGFPLHLLNVSINPQDSDLVRQISQFVSSLANDYHYIVVDLPNDMDDAVMATLIQSDLVQLISVDRHEDLFLTKRVIDHLREALKFNFVKEKVQVILSGLEAKCYLSFSEINKLINYNVEMMLPFIQASELTASVASPYMQALTTNPDSEYARAVTRLARKTSGVLVGLVLGGGAALGVAHVGVIRVLERENIHIDFVVGSSIGALIASLWVVGNNADELEVIAREFEKKKALSKLLDLVVPKSGFIGGKAIERWLRRHLGTKTFAAARIPLAIVAYDLMHREERVITHGSLVSAVRKSVSIPGVINPVEEKDDLIIDGGVLNPLPVNVLTEMGIKKIIAVNVLQSPADVSKGFAASKKLLAEQEKISFRDAPKKYLGFQWQKFLNHLFVPNISDIIVRSLQATEYVISQQSAAHADVVIHPDLAEVNWFELYQVEKLIKSGEEAAMKHLPEIKKLVSE